MIYDLITISLIVTLVIIGTVRGAARMLAGLIVNFVGYLIAAALAKMLAVYIYTSFVRPSIYDSVSQSVADVSNNSINSIVDNMPGFLKGLLSISGEDLSSSLSGTVGSVSDQAAAAVDSAIQPVLVAVISFLMTMLLFAVLSFLLRHFAVRPILGLFELPVVRGFNRFLGGVIGLIDGVLVVSIIAALLNLLLPSIKSTSYLFNESTIYNSYIFYYFYSGNIFTAIASIFR